MEAQSLVAMATPPSYSTAGRTRPFLPVSISPTKTTLSGFLQVSKLRKQQRHRMTTLQSFCLRSCAARSGRSFDSFSDYDSSSEVYEAEFVPLDPPKDDTATAAASRTGPPVYERDFDDGGSRSGFQSRPNQVYGSSPAAGTPNQGGYLAAPNQGYDNNLSSPNQRGYGRGSPAYGAGFSTENPAFGAGPNQPYGARPPPSDRPYGNASNQGYGNAASSTTNQGYGNSASSPTNQGYSGRGTSVSANQGYNAGVSSNDQGYNASPSQGYATGPSPQGYNARSGSPPPPNQGYTTGMGNPNQGYNAGSNQGYGARTNQGYGRLSTPNEGYGAAPNNVTQGYAATPQQGYGGAPVPSPGYGRPSGANPSYSSSSNTPNIDADSSYGMGSANYNEGPGSKTPSLGNPGYGNPNSNISYAGNEHTSYASGSTVPSPYVAGSTAKNPRYSGATGTTNPVYGNPPPPYGSAAQVPPPYGAQNPNINQAPPSYGGPNTPGGAYANSVSSPNPMYAGSPNVPYPINPGSPGPNAVYGNIPPYGLVPNAPNSSYATAPSNAIQTYGGASPGQYTAFGQAPQTYNQPPPFEAYGGGFGQGQQALPQVQDQQPQVSRESFSEIVKKYGKEQPVMLKFIWLEKRLGLALDNVISDFGAFPLTPYYFFPDNNALDELRKAIEQQKWISQSRSSALIKQAEELIALWQKTSSVSA